MKPRSPTSMEAELYLPIRNTPGDLLGEGNVNEPLAVPSNRGSGPEVWRPVDAAGSCQRCGGHQPLLAQQVHGGGDLRGQAVRCHRRDGRLRSARASTSATQHYVIFHVRIDEKNLGQADDRRDLPRRTPPWRRGDRDGRSCRFRHMEEARRVEPDPQPSRTSSSQLSSARRLTIG